MKELHIIVHEQKLENANKAQRVIQIGLEIC